MLTTRNGMSHTYSRDKYNIIRVIVLGILREDNFLDLKICGMSAAYVSLINA